MQKTAHVLNRLPKMLHQIWMADTREDAYEAFDRFLETYQDKYPKVVECLLRDREEWLAIYNFSAPHWQNYVQLT